MKNDIYEKIGIVIVTWNSSCYLGALMKSLEKIQYPTDLWRVFFVDNGSVDATVQELHQFSASVTEVQILLNKINHGFAKASNQGAEEAIQWGAEYLYFLNPDTEVTPEFLAEAQKEMHIDSTIGQVQSLTLREGEKNIQSWGNCLTFLGFGYSGGDGVSINKSFFSLRTRMPPALEQEQASESCLRQSSLEKNDSFTLEEKDEKGASCIDICYASGAAMMVRADAWKEVGGFDEIYESYHEDTDLSLNLRLAGFRVVLAPYSRVTHKYEFSRSIKKYYYLERNRFILSLKFFKMPTLILFFPAFLVMELGTLGFSFLNGFWKEKVKAYMWLVAHFGRVWMRRSALQRQRKYGDRVLVSLLVARVEFQAIMNPILKYIVNPFLSAYWSVVKRAIVW